MNQDDTYSALKHTEDDTFRVLRQCSRAELRELTEYVFLYSHKDDLDSNLNNALEYAGWTRLEWLRTLIKDRK